MSGLCVSSFILALVLALLAMLTLWPGVLLPLALSFLALTTVDSRSRRGRAFAWWALGISLGSGVLGYSETRAMHATTEHLAASVVAALRASSEADRDRLLDPWLATDGAEATRERIQERFDSAQRLAGPAKGGPILPTVWAGIFQLLLPPAGMVPADDPGAENAVPEPGTALWVRVPFEEQELHLALVLAKGNPQAFQDGMTRLVRDSAEFTRPVAVLRDARFFVRRSDAGTSTEPVEAPAMDGGR